MSNVLELEFCVIGGLLLEPSRLLDIDLTHDDFSTEQNRLVFTAICEMSVANEAIDMMTVSTWLEQTTGGSGWLPIVGRIANNTGTAANIKTYASVVRRASTERRARMIAQSLIDSVGEDGAVDAAIGELMRLSATRKNHEHSITDAIKRAVDVIDAAWNCDGIPGVSSGMEDLDECLGGLHRTDLIVIGARPACGKTAFALNVSDRCGVPVGIISGEQANEQIGLRMLSMNGKVSAHKMRTAKLEDDDWVKITAGAAKLHNRQMWINDQPAPTIEQVIRQARKWKQQRGIKLLVIDYLQRIKAKAPNRREEVGLISQALKELARELEIPIVCLAQVNRSVEGRSDKNPMMSDLKEAGEIEQEADVVITLYRDEVYNPESKEKGIMRVNVCKNRHGPTGTIRLTWLAEYMMIRDFDNGRDYD